MRPVRGRRSRAFRISSVDSRPGSPRASANRSPPLRRVSTDALHSTRADARRSAVLPHGCWLSCRIGGLFKLLGQWPNFCFRRACHGACRQSSKPVGPRGRRASGLRARRCRAVSARCERRNASVYIDHERGIGLDDCASVSDQLSAVLDVEDPLQGRYDLEVSSPGLDRPLVFPEHFRRFEGSRAKVRLSEKLEGRRSLEGVLRGCEDGIVSLESDGRLWAIPVNRIEIARLSPSFDGGPVECSCARRSQSCERASGPFMRQPDLYESDEVE
jgi:ribosome maturation factor RimP